LLVNSNPWRRIHRISWNNLYGWNLDSTKVSRVNHTRLRLNRDLISMTRVWLTHLTQVIFSLYRLSFQRFTLNKSTLNMMTLDKLTLKRLVLESLTLKKLTLKRWNLIRLTLKRWALESLALKRCLHCSCTRLFDRNLWFKLYGRTNLIRRSLRDFLRSLWNRHLRGNLNGHF